MKAVLALAFFVAAAHAGAQAGAKPDTSKAGATKGMQAKAPVTPANPGAKAPDSKTTPNQGAKVPNAKGQDTKTAAPNTKAPPDTKTAAPAPGTKAPATPATQQPSATVTQAPVIMREVFGYAQEGRRDPFISLLNSSELRPTTGDLRLTGILYDETGRNSWATMRDITTAEQYRVTTGQTIGRMKVALIKRTTVIFSIEEFGINRQDSLVLGDTTKARAK